MILHLPALPANPLDRFVMLLRHLMLYVGKGHRPDADPAFHTVVWWYVDGLRRRFERLVERFRANTLHPPRPRTTPRAAAAAPRAKPRVVLPRMPGWLCGHVPQHAALYGAWLRALMDDPEIIALIAAGPQAGRVLRPLFHMLGREMPEILILPKRVRKPPATRLAPAPVSPVDASAVSGPPAGDGSAPQAPVATAPAIVPRADGAASETREVPMVPLGVLLMRT
jgi:hypothetical protein